MTTRTITAVVMALGLVAASPGVAPAGGGGQGFGNELGGNIFQCYFINGGSKPGSVLELNDQFTDATDVKIGTATLLCAPTNGDVKSGPFTAFTNPTLADHILCYEAQAPSSIAAGAVVKLTDPLTPGANQTVRVASTKYVCVQAIKECESGCPILDPEP
jgi:hypothetical protein